MKFTAVAFAAAIAAVVGVNAAAESSLHVRIRVHENHAKQGAICYKQCPAGQYCASGTNSCRAPANASECFNPATSLWIAKCDAGFTCSEGKCVAGSSQESGAANGAICYKKCNPGQHCARGTTTCRAPKTGTAECFNPATSLWINKCDKSFKCVQGMCVKA